MKAIEIFSPGPASKLKLVERKKPNFSKDEVLIKVSAVGINQADIMQRKGLYPPPIGQSDLPGLEVSGTIIDGKFKSNTMKIGSKVCALLSGGGYAEYVVAPIKQCLPIPEGLSDIEAASLPEAYFTVWNNLFECKKLQRKKFLIHGGSGGIGTTAILLGKIFNNTVYVTVSNKYKAQESLKIGADYCINYQEKNFVDHMRLLTNGRGVDRILDIFGGDYLDHNLECLSKNGKIFLIALINSHQSTIDLKKILNRGLTITGSNLRFQSVDFKYKIAKSLLKEVWPLFKNDQLKPIIYKTFKLEEAEIAHLIMQERKHIGKIVLKV